MRHTTRPATAASSRASGTPSGWGVGHRPPNQPPSLAFGAMARSWAELLGDAEGPYETQEAHRSFVGRLRESLSKSRRALTEQLAVAAFDPTDSASWERLEEALIQADVGVPATAELVRRLELRQDLGELSTALA